MEELTQDGAQLARTMLMAATQLAEAMARVQAQRAWIAQSQATAQAAQARAQIAAERDAARMIFRPLADDRYWRDPPQLDRVVQAYMTAASWAEHDPEARAAVQLIKNHAEARWGREVGDAMRVPRDPSSDLVREAGDAPMTDRQREFRSKLGVEAGEDMTKVQAFAPIGDRLDAARVPGDELMTERQRKYLTDLGVDPADGMTKAQASQAIKQRLDAPAFDEIRNRGDRSWQEAEMLETVATETVSRQAGDRFDRLVEHADSSDDPAAAGAALELGRSEHQRQGAGVELIASGGRKDRANALQGLTYKHDGEVDPTAKGVPAETQTGRLHSAPGVARPISDSLRNTDGRQSGRRAVRDLSAPKRETVRGADSETRSRRSKTVTRRMNPRPSVPSTFS